VADAVRAHAKPIAGETLAAGMTVRRAAEVDAAAHHVGDGGSVALTVKRAA